MQPFLLPHDRFASDAKMNVRSLDDPMPTITAIGGRQNHLIRPFLVPHNGERAGQEPRCQSVDEPVPTVTASKGAGSIATPFLLKYYGNGHSSSIEDPVPTITAGAEHFALVTPMGHAADIFFRMLNPRELALAQGFGPGFEFAGNKGEVIRQIGNAIPVNTARALSATMLEAVA